ncbi:hypothetical protein J7L06_07735 [Candidatus Bathyarchaeota archaeon]|nr:hypothetical protein [Candidatus Bathyarchaeota archaeon]
MFQGGDKFSNRIRQLSCQKEGIKSLWRGKKLSLSPEEVIDEKDARDATIRADKTYRLCDRLVAQIYEGNEVHCRSKVLFPPPETFYGLNLAGIRKCLI